MKIQMLIEKKITDHLLPDFLKVENESHRHAVPENSETHFKVTIVSDRFNEMRLLARHRLINELLSTRAIRHYLRVGAINQQSMTEMKSCLG